jgi:septum formation protein
MAEAGRRGRTDRVVLASASPRRKGLLEAAGLRVEVVPSNVPEHGLEGEAPRDTALRLAHAKAAACVTDTRVVLAADTVVDLDGVLMDKPRSAEEARACLEALAGHTHIVHTAVVARSGTLERARVVTTRVRFRPLSPRDIERYIETGEPFDKAGGYGIQGQGGALVARVRGSYTNVVGLPLSETLSLLRSFGVQPREEE